MSADALFLHEVVRCLEPGGDDDSGRASEQAEYAELLFRLREDDAAAFEALIVGLVRPLELYARRFTATVDAARDVVQDVFVRLWEQRKTVQVRGSVRAYLYTSVRNRAMDVRKHDKAEAARWAVVDSAGYPPGMGHSAEAADASLARDEMAVRIPQPDTGQRAPNQAPRGGREEPFRLAYMSKTTPNEKFPSRAGAGRPATRGGSGRRG